MTGNRPTVPTALTGAQIAARAAGRFPLSIDPREVVTEVDIEGLAEASLEPKGRPAPVFPPRNWLPVNERVSTALGRAQHALRDLDDQRAIVRTVEIVGELVLIRLLRAPNLDTVRAIRQSRRRNEVVNCADFGEGALQVLLEWPA